MLITCNRLIILSDKLRINTKKLLHLIDQSRDAHKEYHANQGAYFYAKKLRAINEEVLILIKKKEITKDPSLKKFILELKEHLEHWMLLWDKTSNKKFFDDKEEFIFEGYKTYPKKIDALLIRHSKKLKE